MKAVAEDISEVLEGFSELALTFGVDLWVNKEPLSPNNTVTVYSHSGAPSELTYDRTQIKNDNIQIRVRNVNTQTAWQLAMDINKLLNGFANYELLDGSYILNVIGISGPFQLPYDEKGRAIVVSNFNVKRR